jgi:hypothetical protein
MEAREYIEFLCEARGREIFLEAVHRYYDRHGDELLEITSRTKAGLINDYIFAGMRNVLGVLPGFQIIEDGNRRFVGYESRLLIRIKKLRKLGGKRIPSVNRTRSSELFNTQRNMELFPNRAANAYLGYVLNDEVGAVDKIAFLYPNREGTIAWTVEIQSSSIQKSLEMDIVPLQSPAVRRVRIRGAMEEGIADEET